MLPHTSSHPLLPCHSCVCVCVCGLSPTSCSGPSLRAFLLYINQLSHTEPETADYTNSRRHTCIHTYSKHWHALLYPCIDIQYNNHVYLHT